MDTQKDNAISPVVGVMLMLVVVIIIAAIVSAFAGAVVQTGDKTPQATIQGKYRQAGGLELIHAGGDELVTKDIQIVIRKSDEFGSGLSMYSPDVLNTSLIQNSKGKYWFNPTEGTMAVMVWRPGESMYINCSDANANKFATCPAVDPVGGGPTTNNILDYGNLDNIGRRLTLEVTSKNGKMISKSDILIQP
ncbi:MAG: type IV pilin [Methanoregula sp.]|nr:type IV pilin [Methanoregula sp.]